MSETRATTTPLDEMTSLLNSLFIEIEEGRIALWTWWQLQALWDADPIRISQAAGGFFLSTLLAHATSAFLGLTKLLDKGSNTVNLGALIELADSIAGTFQRATPEQVRIIISTLKNDLADMRIRAKPLTAYRNDVLAHTSRDAVYRRAQRRTAWQMQREDVDRIYSDALRLLNAIAEPYCGRTFRGRNVEAETKANVSELIPCISRLVPPSAG